MAKARHGDPEKVLGPLEAQVLRTVWELDRPVGVRDVLEAVNRRGAPPLAYTTVMTVMSRLVTKDVLRRRRDGRAFLYEAAVTDAAEIAVRAVIRDFGQAAIAHFVDEARADPRVLRRLERLLEKGD